jgi:hypothetical protein
LWRHKTAAFAGRFGITDISLMKISFGPRWAYHLQDQILGERLEGVVFPSRAAGEHSFAQMVPMLLARDRAREIQEQSQATQTRLLTDKKFDDSPVWAVPRWFGEKPKVFLPSPEEIRQAQENVVEMKLYAMRMPLMCESGKIEGLD